MPTVGRAHSASARPLRRTARRPRPSSATRNPPRALFLLRQDVHALRHHIVRDDVAARGPDMRALVAELNAVWPPPPLPATQWPPPPAEPPAGGAVFAGLAQWGAHTCPNVLVSSDAPASWGQEPDTPQMIEWVALHELGHALGLGHATNLYESTDLMGYGWPDLGDPVLSDCDLDALAFVVAWALEGSTPYPPGAGSYDCSLD